MTMNMLFLGMNRVSTSLGLIIKKSDKDIKRTGYDPEINNTRAAIEVGGLDNSVNSLSEGVKDADVLFYALPAGKIQEVIPIISQDIKPGCFFVCMTPIGHETFNKVAKILPDHDALIVWYPALNPKYVLDDEFGPRGAKEDLFQNSHVYIAGDVKTYPEALKLGNDLTVLAGSQPINIEPEELAGILALVNDFPLLVSALTIGMVTNEPGWNEARKLAGYNFDHLSALLESPDNQATPDTRMRDNRINLQRLLSVLIDQLSQIYTELDNDESSELVMLVRNASMARRIWQKQRTTMSWLELDRVKTEPPPSLSERLLGKRPK